MVGETGFEPSAPPSWRAYAPASCLPDPSVCAEDHRFWEEWDFSNFSQAIDASFATIATQGNYYGIMLLMPLADSPVFWNNIQLMFGAAASHNLAFQVVLFPKAKYGIANTTNANAEFCYLYNVNAPATCQTVPGTTTAVAYQQLLKLMNFVQNLGDSCASQSFNRPFSIWYGWSTMPGYAVLSSFWNSLPIAPCNLQASYITWLDTGYNDRDVDPIEQYRAYINGGMANANQICKE